MDYKKAWEALKGQLDEKSAFYDRFDNSVCDGIRIARDLMHNLEVDGARGLTSEESPSKLCTCGKDHSGGLKCLASKTTC